MAGQQTTNPFKLDGDASEQPFEGFFDLKSAVLTYLDHGYAPVPCKPKSKHPALNSWPKFECTPDTVSTHFGKKSNVALHLGQSDQVDVDLDALETIKLASNFLPQTNCIFGRESKPASHYVYTVSGEEQRIAFDAQIGGASKMLVEFRAGTNLTIFPPSVHESGETVKFQPGCAGTPSTIDGGELRRAVARLASATLLLSAWPKQAGSRQNVALALAGGLARAKFSQQDAYNFILHVAEAASDEEAEKRAQAVASTYKKSSHDEPVTGWPELAKLLGDGGQYVVDTCRKWLGCADSNGDARKPASQFLLTTKQLAKLDLPKQEEFVSPWMRAGSLALVFSAPKIGKTWFCLQLASDLVSGTEFLKWPVSSPRRVLYVDGEMTLTELQQRVDMMVADSAQRFSLLPSQRLYEAGEHELNLCDTKDQEWLNDAIKSCKADVVILDTLSSLTSGRDENDNTSPELENLLKWLIRLRHRGLAVVLLHHAGHTGRHPRGASRIEGVVDTVVKLSAVPDGTNGQFTISFPRLRGPSPVPAALTVGLKDHGAAMSLEPIGAPKTNHTDIILAHLHAGIVKSQKELAKTLGLSPAHVSNLLKKLRAADLVAKKGVALTSKGQKQVLATSEFQTQPDVQSEVEIP